MNSTQKSLIKCDNCNSRMWALTAAINHQHCVLALCEECANEPRTLKPYAGDENHTVVGRRIDTIAAEIKKQKAAEAPRSVHRYYLLIKGQNAMSFWAPNDKSAGVIARAAVRNWVSATKGKANAITKADCHLRRY